MKDSCLCDLLTEIVHSSELKGNFAIFYMLAKYVPGDITSVFNFPTVINLNYSPLSAVNEANLTSATQTLNFNPTMHF
jgi:hypothetical protein